MRATRRIGYECRSIWKFLIERRGGQVDKKRRQALDEYVHETSPLVGAGSSWITESRIGTDEMPGTRDAYPISVKGVETARPSGPVICQFDVNEVREEGQAQARLDFIGMFARLLEDLRNTGIRRRGCGGVIHASRA